MDRRGIRSRWLIARFAESSYNTQLRRVARHIDHLIKGFLPEDLIKDPTPVTTILNAYARLLLPWATSVANYMVTDVDRRDAKQWKQNSKDMSAAIRTEIAHAPTGQVYRQLMREQVDLITSLPTKAAERVHDLATLGRTQSTRAQEIAADIMRTGQVTTNRARLIARTEVARSAALFTQARAQFAGSDGYIWRTSGDHDVRLTHQDMEGKYVRWDQPPKTDKNLEPYHAGCGPNCRCYAEPVLPNL